MRISLERFERLAHKEAQEILDRLSPELRADAEELILDVEEWPTADHRRSVGAEPGDELLGIYLGVPLVERRSADAFYLPDRIILFHGPHCRTARTEVELRSQIRKTLLHELGHFFGLDEDELLARGVG